MASYALFNVGLNTGWTLGEDGWEAGADYNWLLIDTLLQGRVMSVGLNTPPATPNDGECYIIGTAPTGVWSGFANGIAIRDSGTWTVIVPLEGWKIYDRATEQDYQYTGTAWAVYAIPSATKQAEWDQAYSERNRWDGGSAGLNAVTGRASLSLGTAAQANVTTSSTDTNSGRVWRTNDLVKTVSDVDDNTGRVMTIGNHGIGRDLPPTIPLSSAPRIGFYAASAGDVDNPMGATQPYLNIKITSSYGAQLLFGRSGVAGSPSYGLKYRTMNSGVFNPWGTVWDTGNTSANVQAMLGAANNAAIRSAISASSLPPYTLGTVPSAAANTNLLIIITDLTGGREPCFSDGTNWLRCSDKTIAN